MSYFDAPIAQVRPNPDQPRKHFDEDALNELAQSIRVNGLLEPLIVRADPEVDGGYLLIAGERRWRASRIAGKATVPVRVLDVDEVTAFELSVAENVNRHDMNPMEEANAFATLRGYDRDVAQIAALFGKTTKFVTQRLSLLDLIDEAQAQVAAGVIAASVATQMATCSPANQQSAYFKLMRGDFANDNEALHYVYALRQHEGEVSMFDVEEPTVEQRETHVRAKKATMDALARAERMATALDELAAMEPVDLAALVPDATAFADRIEAVQKSLTRARFVARQAKAIAEARTVDLSEEATA